MLSIIKLLQKQLKNQWIVIIIIIISIFFEDKDNPLHIPKVQLEFAKNSFSLWAQDSIIHS